MGEVDSLMAAIPVLKSLKWFKDLTGCRMNELLVVMVVYLTFEVDSFK